MAAGQGTSSYSKRDLMNLWVQAGGSPAKAGLAASIALAESSGRVSARNQNTNGTVDRGLWQINSIHGDKSTFDPMANARAAVALSNDGASFHPWVTYNTGAYKKYTGSAGGGGTPAPQMLRGSAATTMTRTVPGEVTPGGVGVADLLKALQPEKTSPVMSAPAAPQFSGLGRYLKIGAVPASAGALGGQSKPSIADLLSAVQTTALPVDKKVTTKIPGTTAAAAAGGSSVRGSGNVRIAAGANRAGVGLTPGILKVLRAVAAQAGHTLTVGTGTNHNRLTVDGNVSDHWSGNATDIPSSGQDLTRLGQQALIAAGMDPAQARQQHGGLFNLPYGKHRRIQVIFNTNQGGNHYNHLHVGVTAA